MKIIIKKNLKKIVYANRLMKILKSKSSSLKNISISYFRRFFLKKSILDYDPFFLMAASLLLGSKVAQIKVPFEDIEASFPIIKNSIEKLFSYEFYLATILDYNFYVYNPYHSLLGLIYNLEKNKFFLAQNAENYINPEEFKQGCVDLIDKMYLTDNIFLFSYSEIALASIFLKCYEKNININKVSEKMEIDKIVNIKEFLEGPLEKMKKNLESIPEFENMEEANKRANEIYKVTLYFHKSFPQYQKKLDEERFLLKKKIKDFSDDFDELLDKKGLKDKKK